MPSHALLAQLASAVQAVPSEQFEVHWQTPPGPQVPPPPRQAVPCAIFEHIPLVVPVRAPIQAWQLLPVQALLQQTPCVQNPLEHDEGEVQLAPIGMRAAHTPLLVQNCPEAH